MAKRNAFCLAGFSFGADSPISAQRHCGFRDKWGFTSFSVKKRKKTNFICAADIYVCLPGDDKVIISEIGRDTIDFF